MHRQIIAFDSWTGGAANIERLVPSLRERGLDLLLIHIGSWGHDKGRPAEETIGNLLVRDIRYYGGLSFKEVLRRERPAAVLFLSTQAFAHRAFNRYCRQLGIPTLHLYHGVVMVQDMASRRAYPLNIQSQMALVWFRLSKNVFRLWPLYARALWDTGASLKDWLWFAYDVWRQLSAQSYSGVAAPDASTTACCVYTNPDIPHAMRRYRLPAKSVFAVGNPDLVKFGLREEDIAVCLSPDRTATNEIVYVDTALIEAGAVFNDADDFLQHLRWTNEALARQGFDFVLKLHPVHYRTGLAQRVRQSGINLCGNEDYVARLKTATAAIVEPSSAAQIPALLGLPVLLARYGKLRGQEYGKVLTSYPLGRTLDHADGVRSVLTEMGRGKNLRAVQNWIQENVGPLPVYDMPKRVADVMMEIIPSGR